PLGEVQAMSHSCDFAEGVSRTRHGSPRHSERPGHRLYEQYHPLGIAGIITASNFPAAVCPRNTPQARTRGNPTTPNPPQTT
ncbi:aldehyde dehydrogenase family protein, partial [Chryseobacterium mucoviscidosis]|uniref:aldehyde dehydrogenase family protein n=1 Tax=Chryseobacterium mucoviscidosis TaxID=1945581 RepID=UPI000F50E37D